MTRPDAVDVLDTLMDALGLVAIVVVVGLLLWKAFR
jgi:hypothetical protein